MNGVLTVCVSNVKCSIYFLFSSVSLFRFVSVFSLFDYLLINLFLGL
jgi:hypothetical protein